MRNLLISVLLTFTLTASEPFVFCSLPKSGTHLMLKIFKLLDIEEPFYIGVLNEHESGCFPPHSTEFRDEAIRKIESMVGSSFVCHFNLLYMMQPYLDQSRQVPVLLLVRDLKDVAVSTTFFIDKALTMTLGPKATFNEKLAYVIQGKGILENSVFNVRKQAETALIWIQTPQVHLFRFEDLCGPLGGGDAQKQQEAVLSIANLTGVSMDQLLLDKVICGMWGGTNTFRKGEQGSWRIYFKKYHLRLFEKHLGDLNRQLGYDEN